MWIFQSTRIREAGTHVVQIQVKYGPHLTHVLFFVVQCHAPLWLEICGRVPDEFGWP
jgi:hypothetical protein